MVLAAPPRRSGGVDRARGERAGAREVGEDQAGEAEARADTGGAAGEVGAERRERAREVRVEAKVETKRRSN